MIKHAIMIICITVLVEGQISLEEHFRNCKLGSTDFDDCVKNGINQLSPFFKEGLPEYGMNSFDPFFAAEVPQKMMNPFLNYKLVLRNVSEHGWTASKITKFRTDFDRDQILVTQFFPDKKLNGWYEIEGTLFGQKIRNQGSWNLSLFDYIQTLTISRKYNKNSIEFLNPPIKVKCNIQSCQKLELHIGNLARGRTVIENLLDTVINTAWQPGFIILSPLINDLVSTAFTEIFNKEFQDFPFEKVFKS